MKNFERVNELAKVQSHIMSRKEMTSRLIFFVAFVWLICFLSPLNQHSIIWIINGFFALMIILFFLVYRTLDEYSKRIKEMKENITR